VFLAAAAAAREHGHHYLRPEHLVLGLLAQPDELAGRALVSRGPRVERVVPILNVSDIHASFEWFEKLGWDRRFEWKADPSDDAPGFGAVETGSCEVFLCRDGQGSRGKGANKSTSGPDGDESADKGVWMCIWVVDVGTIHQRCVSEGLDITHPRPTSPGVSANSTSATLTGTSSVLARTSDARDEQPTARKSKVRAPTKHAGRQRLSSSAPPPPITRRTSCAGSSIALSTAARVASRPSFATTGG
jgi:Clp amino terminal domain, pathogenicity island component